MGIIMEQKQVESTVRHKQEGGEVEDPKQMEEGAGTKEQVADDAKKENGKKKKDTEAKEKKRPARKMEGVGG